MTKRRGPDIEQTELYDKITKLETVIIDNISQLKKNKKYYECKHYLDLPDECQQYDHTVNYYDKFWKMYLMNQVCLARINQMKDYISNFVQKIEEIEGMFEKHEKTVNAKFRKKSRRTAEEIEKKHSCPYPKCFRTYGSDVSLNLHIKLKHNGGSKTDREKAAELILEAEQKSLPIPQFRINLPPGFIEQYINHRKNNPQQQPSHGYYESSSMNKQQPISEKYKDQPFHEEESLQ